jgi:hypothetical protein
MRTLRNLPSALLLVLAAGCGDNTSYYRVDVVPEAPGVNCGDGGVRISSGFDDDESGVLEGSEIVDTQYVCNGAPGEGGVGGAVVVKSFDPNGLLMSTQDAPVTLGSATITTDGPGTLVALGGADVFCMGGTDCPSVGTSAAGWFWISDEETTEFQTHDFDYFLMTANITEAVSRTATFDVSAAGEKTIYLRGERELRYPGWFNFYRRSLTLIFLPQ